VSVSNFSSSLSFYHQIDKRAKSGNLLKIDVLSPSTAPTIKISHSPPWLFTLHLYFYSLSDGHRDCKTGQYAVRDWHVLESGNRTPACHWQLTLPDVPSDAAARVSWSHSRMTQGSLQPNNFTSNRLHAVEANSRSAGQEISCPCLWNTKSHFCVWVRHTWSFHSRPISLRFILTFTPRFLKRAFPCRIFVRNF
jgi:hypothetical protein